MLITSSEGQSQPLLPLPRGVVAGQKFGKLQVVERGSNDPSGRVRFHCKCSCGGECVTRLSDLRSGHTKSCGCDRFLAKRHYLFMKTVGNVFVLGKAEDEKGVRASTKWTTVCKLCHAL